MNLKEQTILNVKNILLNNFKIADSKALIIYDNNSTISKLLKQGFEGALVELGNNYQSLEFFSHEESDIQNKIKEEYEKGDVIILIQSKSFRVSKYRWRNELCNLGFKVVEFGQLIKMENEVEDFIKSLTDDFEHYEKISQKLISQIKTTNSIKIVSNNGSVLEYSGEMDKCIRNTGALWEQTNWTTRYPIGEVITEAKDLSILNGEFQAYAYPSLKEQTTIFSKPFTCRVKDGFLIEHNGPKEFDEIFNLIKTENNKELVYVRELGMGLNRHIKRDTMLSDPMSYERVEGLHLSLGMKHGMYGNKLRKEWGKDHYQRFHIDLYVDVKEIYIDNQLVYTQEKGYF